MKVFKIFCESLYYAIYAEKKEDAIEYLLGLTDDVYTLIEEIPESEWDKRNINVWEDNDFDKKPYKISIRESICGTEAQMVFSNDTVFW
jgi:hypothetical protein